MSPVSFVVTVPCDGNAPRLLSALEFPGVPRPVKDVRMQMQSC